MDILQAANNNDADAIRLLIHHGAEDPSTEDSSPFLAAIQWNRFAAAEEFLKLGAEVDFQDSKKMTAGRILSGTRVGPGSWPTNTLARSDPRRWTMR